MSFFAKSKNPPPPPYGDDIYHPIWSNFGLLFGTNFKLFPFFLPSIVALGFFLVYGLPGFFYAALILLLPAGPAIAAMYDLSYQLVRETPRYERRSFFKSYRMNLRQGIATMAILLPVIAMLLLLAIMPAEKPVWVTLCMLLGSVILMAFSILAFSQVALVALPLRSIWKNALYMIPLTHWRCLVPAVVHLVFLAVLYQWISTTFLMLIFLGPALLIAWSANTLWPKLEEILLRGEA